MDVERCTAKAPVNIAVIKYWGKKDEELIIPLNDSLSVTLSTEEMCATTTVACSPSFKKNRIFLNGKEENSDNPRLMNCIKRIKELASKKQGSPLPSWPVHICSENNFPTAAGLASSAAGYACLVYALGSLYGLEDELSAIARLGSGSACRSIYGGFVRWEKGKMPNGSDSRARGIAGENWWPELKILILVVNADQKKVSSSIGMKESVMTSELIHHRSTVIVPKRIKEISGAIQMKDFATFAEITMKDSNQFHAMCLDTYPPIHYLNSTSFAIIDFVHAYNNYYGQTKLAYTFDAGPNACLFMLEKDVPEVLALIKKFFPTIMNDTLHVHGQPVKDCSLPQELVETLGLDVNAGTLQFIISTKVGGGPEIISDPSQHLMDEQGLPI